LILEKVFHVVALVWLFGWGFLLLKFPVECYRFLGRGRNPTPNKLKVVKVVAYIGLFSGSCLLLELAFGLVR